MNPGDKPDGVYFDLPEAEYHALPRLSSHGIVTLNRSARDFWVSSFLNPNRLRRESNAFDVGHAYDCRFLMGAEAFHAKYATAFNPLLHPDAIETIEDMKTWLTEKQVAFKQSAKKGDLIKLCLTTDPECKIMDHLELEYIRRVGGAKQIEPLVFQQITESAAEFESKFMVKHLQGGRAQVAILWTDEKTGVPMRALLDYMKPESTEDLKTFSNPGDKPIDKLIADHIFRYGYFVQLPTYAEARRNAVGLPQFGGEMGFASEAEHAFIFVQKGQSYIHRRRVFGPDLLMYRAGEDIMRRGIDKFAEYWRAYGSNPWPDERPEAELADMDFPLWMLET